MIRKFQIDTGKLVLGGWSYGGGMALAYAASHPEIQRFFRLQEPITVNSRGNTNEIPPLQR